MIYPSIDKLLLVVDSKYRLVHLIAQRSDEIKSKENLQKEKNDYISSKNLGKALEEIADGLIKIDKN